MVCDVSISSHVLTTIHVDLIKEEEARSKTVILDEQLVAEYYEYRQQLDQMAADFREVVTHPTYALPFLRPGRLVKVKYEKLDFGWGVIINYQKRSPPKVRCHTPQRLAWINFSPQNKPMPKSDEFPPHEQYVIDVLLNCAAGGTVSKDRSNVTAAPIGVQPCPSGQKGIPLVVPLLLSTIEGISHLRLTLPKDLRPDQVRQTVWKSVLEVHRRFPDGLALLDPIQNMGIKDDKFKELVRVYIDISCGALSLIYRIRKLIVWRRRCFRVPYTRTRGYRNCTRCTRQRGTAANGYEA
jgi:ATP-dependent RNA helicase DOB1